MTTPYLVCAIVTIISAFVSLGFSVAAVSKSDGEAHTDALYTCARSLPFAILSIVPLDYHSIGWLLAAAIGMAIVQASDALVGLQIKNTVKTVGPAITSILSIASIVWVLNQ